MKKTFYLLIALLAATGISLQSCHKPIQVAAGKENRIPKATAGLDQIIILPENKTILDGSGSTDEDGYIVSFVWTQTSGPTKADLQHPSDVQSEAENLAIGVYNFELTVIDNGGGISKDDVIVTVRGG